MRFPRNFLRWEGLRRQGGTCTICYTALGQARQSRPVCRVDGVMGLCTEKLDRFGRGGGGKIRYLHVRYSWDVIGPLAISMVRCVSLKVYGIRRIFAMCLHVHVMDSFHLGFSLPHLISAFADRTLHHSLCSPRKAWLCTFPIEHATYPRVHVRLRAFVHHCACTTDASTS